ncbi:hypothetical protein DFO45_2663 [Azorhizobium sp. AG788]|uniref:hypothetical protein n=1 Tax=Azorhizobium sp. AG788 TaxID=2183897 RepID=UPI00105BFAB4|nr:hypothetical protein [Azorhizobium sp. AG788]TDT94905.1 hypothetical protein DFO45_2663 [Azorhizobium sp. AG788]
MNDTIITTLISAIYFEHRKEDFPEGGLVIDEHNQPGGPNWSLSFDPAWSGSKPESADWRAICLLEIAAALQMQHPTISFSESA